MSEFYLIYAKLWLKRAILGLTLGMLAISACKKSDTTPLEGTWIEATGRGDTLIFTPTLIQVKRALEIKNGIRVRKTGSGLWTYKMGQKYQIEVVESSSSAANTQAAHLELKDNLLYVSNFYEKENTKYELRAFNKQ